MEPSAISQEKYGRYTVRSLLGEGGMGRVFLADDPVLQRKVALKVISLSPQIDAATRQEYLKRLTLEAQALAQLNHPSIVTVYDTGEEHGAPWIAFELVVGTSLESVLRQEGAVDAGRAVSIALDIAGALRHAHARKIIHRDIKPGNILIEAATGIAKLTDFGVAKAPWTVLTREGTAVGSPGYMAPEQIDGLDLDERADLFSLGVVIYEMVTGKNPFVRETMAATALATVSGSYTRLREVHGGVPAVLDEAVSRCLAADKDERIGSAAELIDCLRPARGGTGSRPPVFARPGAPIDIVRLKSRLGRFSKIGVQFVLWCAEGLNVLLPICKRQLVRLFSRRNAERARRVTVATARVISQAAPLVVRYWPRWKIPRRVVVGIAVTLALIVAGLGVTSAIVSITSHVTFAEAQAAAKDPGRYCRAWPRGKIVAACALLIDKNDLTDAGAIADTLAAGAKTAAEGAVLKGRIALLNDDADSARGAYERARLLPGGRALLSKERDVVIDECKSRLARSEASQPLIGILALSLSAAKSPVVREGVSSKEYWLRWNCVRIMQAAGKRVDMVPVYILDLQSGRGMGTRMDAARKLGELGDRRAIPPLKVAAGRGFRDPFVSITARDVLREHFHMKEW